MLENIKNQCLACEKCQLYKSKTNTVFGCGNKNADIMFVGEAPGESEDMEGVPFGTVRKQKWHDFATVNTMGGYTNLRS